MGEMPAWVWVSAMGATVATGFLYRYRRDLSNPPKTRSTTLIAVASVGVFCAWLFLGVVTSSDLASSTIAGSVFLVVQLVLLVAMVLDTLRAARSRSAGRHVRHPR